LLDSSVDDRRSAIGSAPAGTPSTDKWRQEASFELSLTRRLTSENGLQTSAVVVKGMVFVNSVYSRFGGLPGNVLFAFAPEDQ
jgi:hypothetical protein